MNREINRQIARNINSCMNREINRQIARKIDNQISIFVNYNYIGMQIYKQISTQVYN